MRKKYSGRDSVVKGFLYRGGGQVRIKGDAIWCRNDVSNKRPGGRPWIFGREICRQRWNIYIQNNICEFCVLASFFLSSSQPPWQQTLFGIYHLHFLSCREDNLQSAFLGRLKFRHLAAWRKKKPGGIFSLSP